MNFVIVLVLATIGALIGWITNLLAIKLLFRPFDPINVPLLNFQIQGLIPKRRTEVATSIGKTIENDLLSMEDIMSKLMESNNKAQIILIIRGKINGIISERLPSIIPSAFKGMIQTYIDDIINQEGEQIIAEMMESFIEKGSASINLSQMIEDKINEFPLDKLEEIVIKIAKEELRHIEILGGVLGFIIGLFQGVIVIFLP